MIDYRIPFVGGAVLSAISLVAVQQITGQLKKGRVAPLLVPQSASENLQI
jgi:hypothetical protein